MRALLTMSALVLLFSGCSCAISVSISGSLDDGIVFTLRESRQVKHVGVMTRDEKGEWKAIWRLAGEDKLTAIRYGEATSRLAPTVAAQALAKNRLYAFYVEDDSFWAPCVGSVTFVVTDEGTVEACGTEPCIRKYQ